MSSAPIALRPWTDAEAGQVFIAALTASAVIGSERTKRTDRIKMALPITGATTVTAGSPQPTASSPLLMMLMSSCMLV